MKSYFQFTRKQKIGVAAIGVIILTLVFWLNVNYHRTLPDPSDVDLSQINFTENFDQVDFVSDDDQNYDNSFSTNKSKKNYQLFDFDPNKIIAEEWVKLGFSEKQANSIVAYRDKFGPFNKPEDVQKIYVVSDEKYQEIKPFMIFDYEVSEKKSQIDINSATQEELEEIHGIGPTFAKRTIKYRNLLGGYTSENQFSSIYGITEDAINALENNVIIDLNNISKIKINTASKEEIRQHPYLNEWAVITEIISQRDKTKLKDLNFLIDKELMTKAEVDQVLPYIDFNE